MQKTVIKNRFMPPASWSSELLSTSPLFTDLCQSFAIAPLTTWPDIGWFNHCATHTLVQFVDNEELTADGRYYEEYIYATKRVPTRKDNWHDFFGALIWCLFPKTKALLNRLHMHEISQHGQKQRSKLRNKLTLFDECGVVICLEPAAIKHATLLRTHQWQQSFVDSRADWWQSIRPVIFGHAIYEMATAPFIGLTAKALFVEVPAGFCQWSLTDAYSFLDKNMSQQIANGGLLPDNDQLTPLPLLGVPGWWHQNCQPAFYLNMEYFRPLRAQKSRQQLGSLDD
ncbi:DUF3025 domain-containing protein [Arsukibacterium sp.]|uniref:DUF3025 domain-containing protein n=1 Tax=Arsukibacterium sp. TaxID=1977258 RepID=UPI00299E6315|nr:DUF3025 domain-containing protein [Arsukibacterium sp.]MDX1678230.1 DUF3025 domain-containing protein [Arsukibacterium sp.]